MNEDYPQNNSYRRTTAETSTASFSLTEQVPVACSHFHKCPIYLSQLFSPETPLSLGSQLKRVCVCVQDSILVQDSWLEKLVWLGWNAEISTLELLRRWSWPLSLSFFCPAQLLCQPSRCPTFTEENECIRTRCPKSSRVLTAKASPELARATIHEAFHVEPNPFFILWQTYNSKTCSFDHKICYCKPPSFWALVKAAFLLAACAEGTAYC